ncbi:hypothetical protein Acor_65730 [Acrocarpospora corrugata]|uniref:DUF1440 domain-containing protein n=1 Tax=Acrocarpospora corrugata TaxID=35763 RepID=A0A5M3W660_9ACTN|nr:hypothetical protein Acor_65730 [Acrocarpospora corrugata]
MLATAAMSVVMLAGRRFGVMEEHPPKHITRALMPGPAHRPKPGENVLSFLSHFGFGAVAGSAFAAVARGYRTSAPIGTAYGLAIWLSSYGGWVPSLGILPPISRDYRGRQWVMAVSHVVYGATLAYTLKRLNARKPSGLTSGSRIRGKSGTTRPAPSTASPSHGDDQG